MASVPPRSHEPLFSRVSDMMLLTDVTKEKGEGKENGRRRNEKDGEDIPKAAVGFVSLLGSLGALTWTYYNSSAKKKQRRKEEENKRRGEKSKVRGRRHLFSNLFKPCLFVGFL